MSTTPFELSGASAHPVTHIVLLRVREDVAASEVERVLKEVGALQSKIPGILSYLWGPYSSPEGLGRGYTHGFCMTFVSEAARDAYMPHPEHQRAGRLVSSIVETGSMDGVLAFDFTS
ncbi:Dabb family protein [Pseudonocardia xinjiangensis]|uniref:Dabb family protein n=1 Tax=Pseudonocardia xinjiangensis TaxID=75289 RepID=A0ABX1R968_9PSEU|nr:Dabb family protein [Pseudonocardia xinjiangensis]NMH75665.1 Dabb family protein [Pseudonocardia xinjiangensis]